MEFRLSFGFNTAVRMLVDYARGVAMRRVALMVWALFCLSGCTKSLTDPKHVWRFTFHESGTYSSPAATDLNGDGVSDIVFGAGDAEWMPTANGVVALDGRTGRLLWKHSARNQVVGSPLFARLNDDAVEDVIIGGRSAQLLALDGKTGALIWEYLPFQPGRDYQHDKSILNFYTPRFCGDVNGDGLEDLLTAYGGYVSAAPGDPDRPAGMLKVICAASGRELVSAAMPDGKETYMTPQLLMQQRSQQRLVVFGTGGETIAGNLYAIPFDTLLSGSLAEAKVLASGLYGGFIAPPVLKDVNGDGQEDIVVNAFEGRTLAIDGGKLSLLWDCPHGEGMQTSAMPQGVETKPGEALQFFVNTGAGVWPAIARSTQLWIAGQDGRVIRADTAGALQFGSPLVLRHASSGEARVLYPVNIERESRLPVEAGGGGHDLYYNILEFDATGKRPPAFLFSTDFPGSNVGSTPLVADLDDNGRLDLISIHQTHQQDYFAFDGMVISRYEFPGGFEVVHGEYLGSRHAREGQ